VPLDTKTVPLAPGAIALTADVPLPCSMPLAVSVDAPVPPSATAKSVMPVMEPPVMAMALEFCVATVPSPSAVRAPDAVVLPVPPSAIAIVVPFHVPVMIVPSVVIVAWPA
jgi:hypothetical protein